jgi:hypothetical protein
MAAITAMGQTAAPFRLMFTRLLIPVKHPNGTNVLLFEPMPIHTRNIYYARRKTQCVLFCSPGQSVLVFGAKSLIADYRQELCFWLVFAVTLFK